jgi:hypothetical protein
MAVIYYHWMRKFFYFILFSHSPAVSRFNAMLFFVFLKG